MVDYNLKLNILNHSQKINPNTFKPKTYYEIEIIKENKENKLSNEWKIEKTYEDFETLYSVLKKNHKILPKFPTKGIFSMKTNDNLNKRKDELDLFLKNCILIREVFSDLAFCQFFNIDIEKESYSNENFRKSERLTKVDSFCNNRSIHSLTLISNDRFLVTVNDENKLSKMDAYLTNIEGSSQLVPVSGIRMIRIKDECCVLDKKDFLFTDSIVCISVLNTVDKNLISIGTSNGLVYILEDKEENYYFRLLYKFKAHKKIINGSYFMNEETMITVGKDSIKLWKLENLLMIERRKFSPSVSISKYIEDKLILFVACIDGTISLFNVKDNQLLLSEKLQLSSKLKIKDINVSFQLRRIYACCSKGYCAEIDLSKYENNDCVYSMKEIRFFKIEQSPTKVLIFNNEIILVDKKGSIMFYSNKGELNYSKKICKDKITSIILIDNIIIVGSKDKTVSLWKLLTDKNNEVKEVENIIEKKNIIIEKEPASINQLKSINDNNLRELKDLFITNSEENNNSILKNTINNQENLSDEDSIDGNEKPIKEIDFTN